MKYDPEKLDAYWKEYDRIRAEWRKNGWKGPGAEWRRITYKCGCSYWVGWGVPDKQDVICHLCPRPKS